MNGCTTQLIWGRPADFVDVSHLWPLSVMAAVPTDAVAPDPEDLRDNLVYDIIALRQELKARGYDLADFPDVVKETRALHLPLDAQIQKLQKCAERIREFLMRPAHPSTTRSALLSASAPPLIGPAPSSNSPVLSCQHRLLQPMRWQRAGNRSTNANEKEVQREVSREEEFLIMIPLVLLESSNMESTSDAHRCTNVPTTGLQNWQN